MRMLWTTHRWLFAVLVVLLPATPVFALEPPSGQVFPSQTHLAVFNISNSYRAIEPWTGDFMRFEVSANPPIPNQPVELCGKAGSTAQCSFVGAYTNSQGKWSIIQQIPASAPLGATTIWARVGGIESDPYYYTHKARPDDPAIGASCYLVLSRPHADIWIGERALWTILSRPYGYKGYWYGTHNGAPDASGDPTKHSSNSEWYSDAYADGSQGTYTRWVQFRDKADRFVCNTNPITFSVVNPPVAVHSGGNHSILRLLANFWRLFF